MGIPDSVRQILSCEFGEDCHFDHTLAPYTWWQIGGAADAFIEVSSVDQLNRILKVFAECRVPWCVIGRGTNLLVSDKGYRGGVIHLGDDFSDITLDGRSMSVQAGAWTPLVALTAARGGLSGIEHVVGIPASFGGLVCMNGGSQRKCIGDHVVSVTTLNRDGKQITYTAGECGFAYRKSRFQEGEEIILEVQLAFDACKEYASQRRELLGILRERNKKFPRKMPSCGSVFKSSPKLYAECGAPGKIIEDLGFKGKRVGSIQVSPAHANFIVNCGLGSSRDVLSLVSEIHMLVVKETGFSMEPEFCYLDSERGLVSGLSAINT